MVQVPGWPWRRIFSALWVKMEPLVKEFLGPGGKPLFFFQPRKGRALGILGWKKAVPRKGPWKKFLEKFTGPSWPTKLVPLPKINGLALPYPEMATP